MAAANSRRKSLDVIKPRPGRRVEILPMVLVIVAAFTAELSTSLASDKVPHLNAIVIRRAISRGLADDIYPQSSHLLVIVTNTTDTEVCVADDIEAINVSKGGLCTGHYDYGIDTPRRFRNLQPGQVLVVEDMQVRDAQWEAMCQGDVDLVVRCSGRDSGIAVRARVYDEVRGLK